MTAQVKERLLYEGTDYGMATEPLNQYLMTLEEKPKMVYPDTATRRGYYGEWEIKDNKLYLVNLTVFVGRGEEKGLDYLFPNQTEVFADWFTGVIRVPFGEMLQYVHFGYSSEYESELFIEVNEGVVVGTTTTQNI